MNDTRADAVKEENRRIRTFRLLTDIAMQRLYIEQLSLQQAREIVSGLRTASKKFFPGKVHVFDLVIAPRLERVILERFSPRN